MEGSTVQDCLTFSVLRTQLHSGSIQSSVQTPYLKSDQSVAAGHNGLPTFDKQPLSSFQLPDSTEQEKPPSLPSWLGREALESSNTYRALTNLKGRDKQPNKKWGRNMSRQ